MWARTTPCRSGYVGARHLAGRSTCTCGSKRTKVRVCIRVFVVCVAGCTRLCVHGHMKGLFCPLTAPICALNMLTCACMCLAAWLAACVSLYDSLSFIAWHALPGVLTSPALHACCSASPVCARYCFMTYENNITVMTVLLLSCAALSPYVLEFLL